MFSFKPKNQALDWSLVGNTNIESIINNTDVSKLEQVLANLMSAKLSKDDFVKFGDKSLVKLFKIGQLSIEYLLFAN